MKIKSAKKLNQKLKKYKIIIFDLDDTIYPQKNFDNPSLKNVSNYLSKKFHGDKEKIYKLLRKIKPLRRGKKPNLIFNIFLKKSKTINFNEKLVLILVKKFQNYIPKELKNSPSLKYLLKDNYFKKDLFLVTNGNYLRQKNKIKYLGIKKYFKKIFILDGLRKKLKPSTENVQFLINYLAKNSEKKAVFVGDNSSSDKKFAEKLGINFIHFEFNYKYSF